MEAVAKEMPLIVIVGPTASGKTAVAVDLAEDVGGEIICADSRTVYKGMDIGTAKPTSTERERVPHWGLDLVEPNEMFSVVDFKRYADEKIGEIRARGKVPFLVGGSGLYVDAVVYDYQFGSKADSDRRAYLEKLSLQDLYDYCNKNDISLPENSKNKRYVVRAIERHGQAVRRKSRPISSSIIVGIATDKQCLRRRIGLRSEQMFTNGIVNEATILGKKYGMAHESLTGNIYPVVISYTRGERSLEEAEYKFTTLDWQLAKRQLTWMRSNPHIVWLLREEIAPYLKEVLADA